MDWLRIHRLKILSTILFFFVGSIVFSFGLYLSRGGSLLDSALKVNEYEINFKEYSLLYSRLYKNHVASGKEIDASTNKKLKNEAIQILIRGVVLTKQIDDFEIYVSDQSVVNRIMQREVFHSDGVFNPEKYKNLVENNAEMTLKQFEKEQKKSLGTTYLTQFIASSLRISQSQAELEKDSILSTIQDEEERKLKAMEYEDNIQSLQNSIGQTEYEQVLKSWYGSLNKTLSVTLDEKLVKDLNNPT